MTTFSASLTNLTVVLPQSRDCGYVSRRIRTGPSTVVYAKSYWSTRIQIRAYAR